MIRLLLAILAVLLIIYVVPFSVYGTASALGGLRPPVTTSVGRFFLGILVTKFGTAVAFVLIFSATKDLWGDRWLLYAAMWFSMFALSEIGEAIMGRTTRVEAALGILSQAMWLANTGLQPTLLRCAPQRG